MERGFGGGQPYGLAAALARGRRPPKAGGGPTKYHRLAFRNSLHQVGIKHMHRAACREGTLYPAALCLEYLRPVVVEKERRRQKALLQDGKRVT